MNMNSFYQQQCGNSSNRASLVCFIVISAVIIQLSDNIQTEQIVGDNNHKRELIHKAVYHSDKSFPSSDDLDASNLARLRGFSIEAHTVVTEDHYVLTIHRLINPLIENLVPKGVIIMQHGILCSSSFYLINSSPKFDDAKQYLADKCYNDSSAGCGNNLAFSLSNLGFDVWLTNFRGNQYSRQHLLFQDSDPRYWNFTVDSLVQYDYKAYVNYILDYTKASKYTFIGHSLGATVGLGSLLVHNNTAMTNNLACSILMAPVASTKYIKGSLIPFFKLAIAIYNELSPFPGPIGPHNILVQHVCTYLAPLCYWFAETFTGKTSSKGDKKRKFIEIFTKNYTKLPDFPNSNDDSNDSRAHKFIFFHVLNQSISVLMLKHIVQVYTSGRLSRFNHGPRVNLQLYGTALPPPYDITKVHQQDLKVALVSGPSDAISTMSEIDWIAEQIKNGVGRVEKISARVEEFNHLDLVISNEAGKLINIPIVEFIERNKCF